MTAHLSEHAISASLLPGAARPRCEVPGCTRCEAALVEAHGAATAFREEILPRTLPVIRARLEDRAVPWWRARWWLTGPLALAATAAVVLAVWPREVVVDPRGGDPVLIAKGGASDEDVRIFVKREGRCIGWRRMGRSSRGCAAVRDRRAGARYALVVSIDAAGRFSVYAPFDGVQSAAVAGGELPVELPESVVLDETLGEERVWVVLSEVPVVAAAVKGQLERGGEVPGARVIAVKLRKTAR